MDGPSLGGGWTFTRIAITIVVCIAIVALVYLAAQVMGVAIPAWAVTAFWICAICFVIVMAIKFVGSL